jgi:hypothetical protein
VPCTQHESLTLYALTEDAETKSKGGAGFEGASTAFRAFQQNYLTVYYMAMMSDWLQVYDRSNRPTQGTHI